MPSEFDMGVKMLGEPVPASSAAALFKVDKKDNSVTFNPERPNKELYLPLALKGLEASLTRKENQRKVSSIEATPNEERVRLRNNT